MLSSAEYLLATASNQPHLLGLPVVEPNSPPFSRRCIPISLSCSVGNGPPPTRVMYAFIIPTISPKCFGPIPVPAITPPIDAFDEVTNGYVPWSMSRRLPFAPFNQDRFSFF